MPVEFSCKAVAFVAGGIMAVAKVNRKTVRVVQSRSDDSFSLSPFALHGWMFCSHFLSFSSLQGHSSTYLLEPELHVELKSNLKLPRFIAGVAVLMRFWIK